MCAEISSLVAVCGRCGFTTRGMISSDAIAAYPHRAASARHCPRRRESGGPWSCPAFETDHRSGAVQVSDELVALRM